MAEIREVLPHPNADRLTLLDLYDGRQQQTVLTGAPNIFHLKGTGKLPKPIKVAYAKEGSTIYDGHADGLARPAFLPTARQQVSVNVKQMLRNQHSRSGN